MKRFSAVVAMMLGLVACQGGSGSNNGAGGASNNAGQAGSGGSFAGPGGAGPWGSAGAGGTNAVAGQGGDANGGAGGNAGADGSAGAGGQSARCAAIEALLIQRAGQAAVSDLGLTVWDAHDRKICERMLGAFTPDTGVAVASASKMVSGLVIFDLIRRGLLSLDSTTGQVLGWTGANGAITLRHLLSFTSGLPREAACTANPRATLAECAATMATATPTAAPGTLFDYGSTHLLVAASMAETVTGMAWDDVFAATLRAPFGLSADVTYFTAPRQATGTTNPLVAGGLRASIDDYRNFLALDFHQGNYGGVTIGTPALFEAQRKQPFPDVMIGSSPLPAFRYGLTAWLECATPAAGCQLLASPGAFGFTPWFDRDTGYYAILGMELASTGSDEGVVAFAVTLQAELQPLIAAALAAR